MICMQNAHCWTLPDIDEGKSRVFEPKGQSLFLACSLDHGQAPAGPGA
jgi:hypothetical protein